MCYCYRTSVASSLSFALTTHVVCPKSGMNSSDGCNAKPHRAHLMDNFLFNERILHKTCLEHSREKVCYSLSYTYFQQCICIYVMSPPRNIQNIGKCKESHRSYTNSYHCITVVVVTAASKIFRNVREGVSLYVWSAVGRKKSAISGR